MADLSLREKQSLFVKLLAQLVDWIYGKGWELTLGEGYRSDGRGHMEHSLHYLKLAQDLNLFVNGDYVSDGSSLIWNEIGEHWETMHPLCRWGGRFNDANHFSLRHGGRS